MEQTTIPAGYKMTELGLLPQEWEISELGPLLASRPKYGINAAAVNYSDLLPTYLRITDISEEGQFIESSKVSVNHPFADKYFLSENDIVFARTGASVGKTYIHSKGSLKLVFAGFLIKATADHKKLDPNFLKAYTETEVYWKWVAMTSMRSGQPGINGLEYAKLRVPLPPLAEQHAIAAALGEVDALLAAQRARLAKQRAVKQGLLQTLLRGEKRLPGFAGEWEVKRLGDLSIMFSGGTPDSSNPEFYGGSFAWVSITDMTKGGKFLHRTERSLSAKGLAVSAAKMFPAGTILYAMYASIGECIIAGLPVCTSQAILGITPNKRLDNDYLYYWLTSVKEEVKSLGQQGTQANLNKKIVQDFTINLPPPDEQRAIAAVLGEADAALAALEAEHAKTQLLKQGLMQNLLTGKLRLPL